MLIQWLYSPTLRSLSNLRSLERLATTSRREELVHERPLEFCGEGDQSLLPLYRALNCR